MAQCKDRSKLSTLDNNPKFLKSKKEMNAQNNGLQGEKNLVRIVDFCIKENVCTTIADDFLHSGNPPTEVPNPQLENNTRISSVIAREDKTDSVVSEATTINSLGAGRNACKTIKEINGLQHDLCSITSEHNRPCCFMRFFCCVGGKMRRRKIKQCKDISAQTSLCLMGQSDDIQENTQFNYNKKELGTELTRSYNAESGCIWLWDGEKMQHGFDVKLCIENMIKDQLDCLSAKHGFEYGMTTLPPVKNTAHKLMADEASRLKAIVSDVILKKYESTRLKRIKKVRSEKLRTSLTVAMLKKRSDQLRMKKAMTYRLHGKKTDSNVCKYTLSKHTNAEGDTHAGQIGFIPYAVNESIHYCENKSRTHSSHIPIITMPQSHKCKNSTAADEKTYSRKHSSRNKTAELSKIKKPSTVRKESNLDKRHRDRSENNEKQSLIMQLKKNTSQTRKNKVIDQVDKSGLTSGSYSAAKRITQYVSLSPECDSKTSTDSHHKTKKIHRHKSMDLNSGNTLDEEGSVQRKLATGGKRDVSRRKNESNQNHVSHKLQNVGTISNELQKFGNDIEYTRELLNDVVRQLEHAN